MLAAARAAAPDRSARRCSAHRPRLLRPPPRSGIAGSASGTTRPGAASSRVRFSTICGMTSPARCSTTRSPGRTPSRAISSALCNVALRTTTPPTVTGLQLARLGSACRCARLVCRCPRARSSAARSAGNLCAIAQRGAFATDESQPRLPVEPVDLVDHAVDVERQVGALVLLDRGIMGERVVDLLEPQQQIADRHAPRGNRRASRHIAYRPGSAVVSPQPCARKRNGRLAVTLASFWRSDPAAALRGLANCRASLPVPAASASRRALNAAKSALAI